MSIDTKIIRDLHAKRGDHPWGSSFEYVAYQHMPELLDAYDRLAALEAARLAYASEFPLNAEGEPDTDNIHQNIRALKQRLAELEEELASAREAERVQRERAERERGRAHLYRNAVPESADYVDALDHIMRTARRSRTQSRRLRWIEARARCALEGGEDWKELDLPRFSESNQRYLKARIADLEEALAAGGD